MHVEPDVEIRGIRLRDYYCDQLYKMFTPGNPQSLPLPENLPDATYQFTCEFGGLLKTLLLLPDVIWPYFTRKQKDEMAVCISKWAHHRTTQNNWRLFNIVRPLLPEEARIRDRRRPAEEPPSSGSSHTIRARAGTSSRPTTTTPSASSSFTGPSGAATFGDEHYPE